MHDIEAISHHADLESRKRNDAHNYRQKGLHMTTTRTAAGSTARFSAMREDMGELACATGNSRRLLEAGGLACVTYMKSATVRGRLSSVTVPGPASRHLSSEIGQVALLLFKLASEQQMLTAFMATNIYRRCTVVVLMLLIAVALTVGPWTLAATAQSASTKETLKIERHCRGKVVPNIYFCLFDEQNARMLTESTLSVEGLNKWTPRRTLILDPCGMI